MRATTGTGAVGSTGIVTRICDTVAPTAGPVTPQNGASGAYVALLGRHTALGKKAKTTSFTRLVKLTISKGHTAFTIHANLKRGYRWQLKTEYVRPGHKAGQHVDGQRVGSECTHVAYERAPGWPGHHALDDADGRNSSLRDR